MTAARVDAADGRRRAAAARSGAAGGEGCHERRPLPHRHGDVGLPLLVSVQDAAHLLGIGRMRCFELLITGEIKSVKLYGRRLVVREDLEGFVERLLAGAHLAPPA